MLGYVIFDLAQKHAKLIQANPEIAFKLGITDKNGNRRYRCSSLYEMQSEIDAIERYGF